VTSIVALFILQSQTVYGGTSFLNGRYNATTDVSDCANIMKDVKGIRHAETKVEAIYIYQEGKNSIRPNSDEKRTLSSLSKNAMNEMAREPEFNKFLHALAFNPLTGEASGQPYASAAYADLFVMEKINNEEFAIAAEASVVLNLWMYTIHKLREATGDCMSDSLNDIHAQTRALDEAVAFYVGLTGAKDTAEGDYSLYSVAQRAAKLTLQEASTNKMFINSANKIQQLIIYPSDTSDSKETCLSVRREVNNMVTQMTIPLLKKFITHFSMDDPKRLKLYALAFLPLIEGCNEVDFAELFADFFITDNDKNALEVMGKLQDAYECLGISCDDVGMSDTYPCVDKNQKTQIVGYEPSYDVRESLKIDLDTLQIKLYLENKAINDDAYEVVKDLYMFGRNSKRGDGTYEKIHHLATSKHRARYPYFENYTVYFRNTFKEWFTEYAEDQLDEKAEHYAEAIIMRALNKEEEFENASNRQVTRMVHKTVQFMIMHMYILEKLYSAVEYCQQPDIELGVQTWDEIWAFYVGSIEGSVISGKHLQGQSMYTLSNKRCERFSACDGKGINSKINDQLLTIFKSTRDQFANNACDIIETTIQNEIEPRLLATSIQGALTYAIKNENLGTLETTGDISAGYLYGMSTLPLVEKANANSASVIEKNLNFWLPDSPDPDGAKAVFDAYRNALNLMNVDCELIGSESIDGFGDLCRSYDTDAINPGNDADGDTDADGDIDGVTDGDADSNTDIDTDTDVDGATDGDDEDHDGDTDGDANVDTDGVTDGDVDDGENVDADGVTDFDTDGDEDSEISEGDSTVLADGLFVTSTNVLDRAMIARDVKEMFDAIRAGDTEAAKDVYRNGKYSEMVSEDGTLTGNFRSLKKLSLNALTKMQGDPAFNIFRYGLSEGKSIDAFMERPIEQYADTFIEKAFGEMEEKDTLPAEAVVVLNIWMYTVHKLYNAVQQCKDSEDSTNSIISIDEAAAFYIGSLQKTGNPDSGYMLYNFAEDTGEHFGQDGTGQVWANTKILKLLNKAKSELSYSKACSNKSDTASELLYIYDEILPQMTIPLMQNLVRYMYVDDKKRVALYALAVVPMIAGCDTGTFSYLKEALIENEYNRNSFEYILRALQNSYSCLKITCGDIGPYIQSLVPECSDQEILEPIAGYTPITDVREELKIDIDILQMRILMTYNATDAAKDLYMYGGNSKKHEDEFWTLQRLATSNKREEVPQYELYRSYFDDDENYADTTIMDVLDWKESSRFNKASLEQRTEAVVKTLQYQVMYMYTLRELYDAVHDCESTEPNRHAGMAEGWDRAVAFFVGSMEGKDAGGSLVNDGQLLYALAKERCYQFNTCNGPVDAYANTKIIDLMTAAKIDIEKSQCSMLGSKVEAIKPLLSIGMIQSVFLYAKKNSLLPTGSKDGDLASGDVLYTSIAPIIHEANRNAADIIKRNMDFQVNLKNSPIPDGPDEIFQAMTDTMSAMSVKQGLDCKDIGRGVSCATVSLLHSAASGMMHVSTIVLISLLGVVTLLAC